ncbi:hypothetical protein ACFFTM_25360 [Pseudoduganella plicata]|uniref:TonB C-terminal domain-containing protein n=1 Tax=Pseudoduganella plicata TaxID=321984 RepID=A0A4P7BGY2_9BURK|nr:hypothetical protein [Pseudoduganella plicata]QBQ37550.1 hypothetical protein E1742_16290 [Pseudoduganella plicata]GGY91207.1 hypothetical protein GCM10007388_25570 [Pseudoduganella plicata]
MRKQTLSAGAIALFMCGSLVAQSRLPAPQYKLKAEERTGSHLRRDAARGRIPFDKTYAELTDEQKAIVRAPYESMAADDEPPFPKHGLKRVYETIVQIRRRVHMEGIFDAGVMVGPDGKASEVRVYRSPDPEVTKLFANLLVLQEYKPPLCHGVPCTQEYAFKVDLQYTW